MTTNLATEGCVTTVSITQLDGFVKRVQICTSAHLGRHWMLLMFVNRVTVIFRESLTVETVQRWVTVSPFDTVDMYVHFELPVHL